MTKAIIFVCVLDAMQSTLVFAMYYDETRHKALLDVLATITMQTCGKALSLARTRLVLNVLEPMETSGRKLYTKHARLRLGCSAQFARVIKLCETTQVCGFGPWPEYSRESGRVGVTSLVAIARDLA